MGEVLALDWSRPYRALRHSLTTLTRVSRKQKPQHAGSPCYLFEDFEYEMFTPRNSLWRFQPEQGSFGRYWTKREETQIWHGRSARDRKVTQVNLRTLELLSVFVRKRYLEINESDTFDIWIWILKIINRYLVISFRLSKILTRDSLQVRVNASYQQVSRKPRLRRLKLVDVYPDCPPTFACAPRPAMNWLMQQLVSLSHAVL